MLWIRGILVRIRVHKFFCVLLFCFEGKFTSVFKDKKPWRGRKTVEIKVFLTIFAWWWKDPDPYFWLTDPDPRYPKTYKSVSTTLHSGDETCFPFYENHLLEASVRYFWKLCANGRLEWAGWVYCRLHGWRVGPVKSRNVSVCLGLSCNMRDGGKPFLSEADIPGGERLALRRA